MHVATYWQGVPLGRWSGYDTSDSAKVVTYRLSKDMAPMLSIDVAAGTSARMNILGIYVGL